nr:hypothetical protein [Pseudomonas chlororaphis]
MPDSSTACIVALTLATFASANTQSSADATTLVGVDNFARAESDLYMAKGVESGGLGRFVHIREPVAIDAQDVIRMNTEWPMEFSKARARRFINSIIRVRASLSDRWATAIGTYT